MQSGGFYGVVFLERGGGFVEVLFVCHGNICRSPMAEFILKDLLKKEGITSVEVDSVAASREEIGNPIYPPAQRELTKLQALR